MRCAVKDHDSHVHADVSAIHEEHHELVAQLDEMDAALEKLVCYSELFSDLATANQALARGKWMAEWLPRHYQCEETTVLATIAEMSPELASFSREMKRQHKQLRLRLENLREMLNRLPAATDMEGAVTSVKLAGGEFTRMMRLHIAAEENKFAALDS